MAVYKIQVNIKQLNKWMTGAIRIEPTVPYIILMRNVTSLRSTDWAILLTIIGCSCDRYASLHGQVHKMSVAAKSEYV